MVTIKQALDATRADSHKELDRLLKLLAAQQRPVNSGLSKSASVYLEGEITEALAVFIAQRRVRRTHTGGAADPPADQARAGSQVRDRHDVDPTNGMRLTRSTPLPASLPMLASGLALLGSLSWRRKRNAAAVTA